MFDMIGKYQASLFVNLADISPTPELISKLLMLFKDKNLLPNTFQEISVHTPRPQTRLRLSSQNNEWNLNFATHRLDIEKNATDPKGQNLGTAEEFAEQVHELFNRILTEFRKKGDRISLITSGLLKEMPEEKLADIYDRLFNPIPFYGDNPPFEWNTRSVARKTLEINSIQESINVITDINRVRGQLIQPNNILEFDRIEIGFDINTIQENQETRFSVDAIESFFAGANEIRNHILKDLEVFLDV